MSVSDLHFRHEIITYLFQNNVEFGKLRHTMTNKIPVRPKTEHLIVFSLAK